MVSLHFPPWMSLYIATLVPLHCITPSLGQLKESDVNTVTGCICAQRWRKEERRRVHVERKCKIGRKWEGEEEEEEEEEKEECSDGEHIKEAGGEEREGVQIAC